MRTISLTGLLVFLAAFGGVYFYRVLPLLLPLLTAVIVAAVVLAWRSRRISPASRAAIPLLAALATSAALHPGPVAAGRLFLDLAAWAALDLAWRIERETLRQALSRLAWLLPLLVFTQTDNANILAVWPVVSALAGGPLWLCVLLLLYLGSRGALVGLAAGFFTLYALRFTLRAPRLTLYSLAGLLLALLILWRPTTAGYRLNYWQAALTAWLTSPWAGLGPGGLWAGRWIAEPGGGWQLHAHNAPLTWLAETGLTGFLFVALSLYVLRFTPLRLDRWQLAVLAAGAAWSLVDEPLFWPGPLLLAALVVGAECGIIKSRVDAEQLPEATR